MTVDKTPGSTFSRDPVRGRILSVVIISNGIILIYNYSRVNTVWWYVFPSIWEDKTVLDATLRSNVDDTTAHYLLGTWYFARAMTAEALREWDASRRLNPKIPALDANLGLALLHEHRDFAGALRAFESGIKDDPKNNVNLLGRFGGDGCFGEPAFGAGRNVRALP
jgi:tetratricopeptide (TPR) repeat protein